MHTSVGRPLPRVCVLLAAAAGLVIALFVVAAPSYASSSECATDPDGSPSGNACEYVTNAATGSDDVIRIQVWAPSDVTYWAYTYRVLINGQVWASHYGGTPQSGANNQSQEGWTFTVNTVFVAGTCLQGGVVGLPNARTPCWNVP